MAISSDTEAISLTNCESGIRPYALGIATLELELFRQRQKAKELYATHRLKTNYLDISITLLKFLK